MAAFLAFWNLQESAGHDLSRTMSLLGAGLNRNFAASLLLNAAAAGSSLWFIRLAVLRFGLPLNGASTNSQNMRFI
jgi:hypothetical protein